MGATVVAKGKLFVPRNGKVEFNASFILSARFSYVSEAFNISLLAAGGFNSDGTCVSGTTTLLEGDIAFAVPDSMRASLAAEAIFTCDTGLIEGLVSMKEFTVKIDDNLELTINDFNAAFELKPAPSNTDVLEYTSESDWRVNISGTLRLGGEPGMPPWELAGWLRTDFGADNGGEVYFGSIDLEASLHISKEVASGFSLVGNFTFQYPCKVIEAQAAMGLDVPGVYVDTMWMSLRYVCEGHQDPAAPNMIFSAFGGVDNFTVAGAFVLSDVEAYLIAEKSPRGKHLTFFKGGITGEEAYCAGSTMQYNAGSWRCILYIHLDVCTIHSVICVFGKTHP